MKRKVSTLLAITLVVSMLAAGCGAGGARDLMARVKAAGTPVESNEPVEAFIDSEGDFSWNLFRTAADTENVLISPASVYIALAMTLNGADGSTREAMLSSLSASGLSLDQLNTANRDWIALLTDTDGKTIMKVANSIWYNDDFNANPDFLKSNANYYMSALRKMDFADPKSADIINSWVKDATNGKIDKIMDSTDEGDVMYLINAVYFKADWLNQFFTAASKEGPFTLADGTAIATYMQREAEIEYLSGEFGEGVLLPYADQRYAFFAVLPASGKTPRDIVAAMDTDSFNELLRTRRPIYLDLSLPKFEIHYEIDLVENLTALGMGEAFDPGLADFSLMETDGDKGLFISGIGHKTFLRLDEFGTEAAAVTSITIASTAIAKDGQKLTFDRPFLYGIVDTITGLPLFLGILDDPEA